jgi:TonB family protein
MDMRLANHISTVELGKLLRNACMGIAIMGVFCGMASKASAQTTEQQTLSDRKVVTRIEPEYPETLKRLYIGGVVRVQVVVQPTGEVASTELVGGSPILGQSAMKAIKQWKYAKAPSPETLIVRLEFDPHR